jgi:hypothetical protein
MEKVSEPVNWSAIAARAFEGKLAEISARKEMSSMVDVVQRLRLSKQDHDSQVFREGFNLGSEWAKRDAGAAQLEHLEAIFAEPAPISCTDQLLVTWLTPEYDEAPQLFWEDAIGDQNDSRLTNVRFLRGFVDGALAVWREVKQQL